jgi:hypothetical protein
MGIAYQAVESLKVTGLELAISQPFGFHRAIRRGSTFTRKNVRNTSISGESAGESSTAIVSVFQYACSREQMRHQLVLKRRWRELLAYLQAET